MWVKIKALRSRFPDRSTLLGEMLAAVPGAVGSVPDGMASGLLAGVSPVNGLYASAAGRVAGGLTSSTRLMVVTTTSAAALAAGSALSTVAPAQRAGAMTLLTLMAGILMLGAGLARLGRYTRFVSHSVMTGFLTGISANIIFSQIPDLLGANGVGGFPLAKTVSVLTHPSTISVASLLTGSAAAAIILILARTPLSAYGAVLALIVPTVLVALVGVEGVARVSDAGEVPAGFPLPALPDFGAFSLSLVGGAFAVAAIVLVQGAGVAQSAPNPADAPASVDRDFLSQGWGNIASSLVRGLPVGGSVGQTALNVASGARTRWAAIFSGVWLLLILLALSKLVGLVAQPTLAALLMVAAVGSIHPAQIMTILRTSATSRVALTATFIATLLLPVATAVGVGVALSLILQLNQEAMDLKIVRLIPTPAGWREEKLEKTLTSGTVMVLDVYGSLLYAGSRTLESQLPDPTGSKPAAVVIRLRGRTELGATFFLVIRTYARTLHAEGGRLFLSGVDPHLGAQWERDRGSPEHDILDVFQATQMVGASTDAAIERANRWVREH